MTTYSSKKNVYKNFVGNWKPVLASFLHGNEANYTTLEKFTSVCMSKLWATLWKCSNYKLCKKIFKKDQWRGNGLRSSLWLFVHYQILYKNISKELAMRYRCCLNPSLSDDYSFDSDNTRLGYTFTKDYCTKSTLLIT